LNPVDLFLVTRLQLHNLFVLARLQLLHLLLAARLRRRTTCG
jgi:hypothetical protein